MADFAGASFPVLADATQYVAKSYGVYNLMNDNVAAPATFIIDSNGDVVWRHVASDISDRPTSTEILAAIDRLME